MRPHARYQLPWGWALPILAWCLRSVVGTEGVPAVLPPPRFLYATSNQQAYGMAPAPMAAMSPGIPIAFAPGAAPAAPPAAAAPFAAPGLPLPPVQQPVDTVKMTKDKVIGERMGEIRTAAEEAAAKEIEEIAAAAMRVKDEGAAAMQAETDKATAVQMEQLDKITKEQDEELQKMIDNTTKEAEKNLGTAQDEAVKAAETAAVKAVRDVETKARSDAQKLLLKAGKMMEEAGDLEVQAKDAANITTIAAENAHVWISALPADEAKNATKFATSAEAIAVDLRNNAGKTKRLAKLVGNLALQTLHSSEEAEVITQEAIETAKAALTQANANAIMANTIRLEVQEATNTVTKAGDATTKTIEAQNKNREEKEAWEQAQKDAEKAAAEPEVGIGLLAKKKKTFAAVTPAKSRK
eukprot:gnl/TRDRNA2_/TRDRNA2_179196_c0_seq1.p1 gnl/TRDRNA2_/TRDRNA2_179196_c0~~gnl/TRDRNA2_/TRDRNA2_179196_c0_seq1.p1  ORF type:complete len:443 (+),score=125.78 gnl/TRDRNA2_/TRDRNA2_179196_c0_seq1:99-1331(+)